jgi:hypothetical protein
VGVIVDLYPGMGKKKNSAQASGSLAGEIDQAVQQKSR